MKKSIFTAFVVMGLSLVTAVASAADFKPGQRTYRLLGATLNSDVHPVHFAVEQTVDMKKMLPADKYAALAPEKRIVVHRTEYDELNGTTAERNIKMDATGKVEQDITRFVNGKYWFSINRTSKAYDRIPAVEGSSRAFAEQLVPWFDKTPDSGYDAALDLDYDRMLMGSRTLTFYYEKGTDKWVGYAVSGMPMYKVVELSQVVNSEEAFRLPKEGEGYRRLEDKVIRAYAERVVLKPLRDGKKNKKAKKNK